MQRGWSIKEEDGKFVLYDDEFVFSRYDTREDAESEKLEQEQEAELANAVSDAVDDMLDNLSSKFPNTDRSKLRLMIAELLS